MPAYYIDSSALVKRYIGEDGSEVVDRVLDDPDQRCYISRIAGAEVVATLARRGRGERWTEQQIDERIDLLHDDLRSRYRLVDASRAILSDSMNTARRHGLRGYDAVHLTTAVRVNIVRIDQGALPVILMSSDDELNIAAEAEGLTVLNPLD
ncbi:MAG: type II toxin-antitoxin system VapC family toxin [Candidatus Poribacteria bacterium]